MASRAKKGRKSKGGTLSEAPTESTSWSLSSFSPDSSFFVHISLALDKHRLRLYNTATGRALAEHVFESGRATTISWVLSPTTAATVSLEPSSKRRRKKKNLEADATSGPVPAASAPVTLLAIGLSNGSISLFSPTQGRLTNTLSHPNSTSRILSLSSSPAEQGILWASNAQGALLAWDIPSNTLSRTLKSTLSSSNSTSPCTAIAVHPSPHSNAPADLSKANVRILTAHHTIRLVTPSSSGAGVDGPGGDVREIASFTGHASPVVALDWAPSSSPSSSKDAFVSIAEGDRFVSVWGVPSSSEEDEQEEEELREGSIMASIPLDTAVRSVSFSRPPLAHSSSSSATTSVSPPSSLLAISVSGTLHIFPFPISSKKSASGSSKVPTAATEPSTKTIIRTPPDGAKIISATFIDLIDGDQASGRALKIARLASGVKPIFDIVKYLDQNGAYIPEVKLKSPPSNDADADVDSAIQIKRYTEGQTLNVRSGHELPEGVGADERMQYGELDAELAELSLGQRLAVPAPTIKDDDPVSGSKKKKLDTPASKPADDEGAPRIRMTTDAISLTRTLTQALHSSDMRLLESVLAHSSQTLINNTVRRLPPQLAVPLLTACVERLNRGARAGTGKGRGDGSGASAQRGTLMVRWIRAVLVGHTAYLMTIPDLVTRLSGLHTTITSRLSLQERLLTLNGRLDLVLSQIELRSSEAPAPVSGVRGGTGKSQIGARAGGGRKQKGEEGVAVKYVEGESETDGDDDAGATSAREADEMDVDVEVDSGEDEGSVEDVELGGESGSDSQSGSEDEDDEEDDSDDKDQESGDEDGAPRVNGFLDAEAAETWSEDESEESEEE